MRLKYTTANPIVSATVIRVIERTVDKPGQHLLIPDIALEGWWTTLAETDHADDQVIALYRDHATSEQFHSEFKTDLDIERLPSGKFATNALIMTLATFSYNMLRWIGLISLVGDVSPVRHPAKRRRLRTVIQELMYLAARLIETGRRLDVTLLSELSRLPRCFTRHITDSQADSRSASPAVSR